MVVVVSVCAYAHLTLCHTPTVTHSLTSSTPLYIAPCFLLRGTYGNTPDLEGARIIRNYIRLS